MKTAFALLFVIVPAIDMMAQTNRPALRDTESLLLKMDEDWNQALLHQDLKYWLGAVSTDLFVIVDEKARLSDLTSYIAYVSTTYFTSVNSIDRFVNVYDSFAVLVGFRSETFRQPTRDDPDQSRRVRYTKVFRKTEQGWLVVAYHETRYGPF